MSLALFQSALLCAIVCVSDIRSKGMRFLFLGFFFQGLCDSFFKPAKIKDKKTSAALPAKKEESASVNIGYPYSLC